MDTTHDLKKKKRKPEPTLEKQFQDNIEKCSKGDGYFADGKWVEMAADLKNLPEIDYTDPNVQKWIKETESRWKKNNPKLTHDELIEAVEKKVRGSRLQEQFLNRVVGKEFLGAS